MKRAIDRFPFRFSSFVILLLMAPLSISAAAPPNPPAGFEADFTGAGYRLTWVNPSERADGSPLDDFGGVRIYRNGALIETLGRPRPAAGLEDEYILDSFNFLGGWYFQIQAFDRSSPPEYSDPVGAETFRVSPDPVHIAIPWKSAEPVTVGLTYVNISDYVSASFYSGASWLLVRPSAAMVYPGGSQHVLVTTNSWSLAPGTYQTTISVNLKPVPLILDVLPAPPAALIEPESIDFSRLDGSGPVHAAILVANDGYDDLEVQLGADVAWIRPLPGLNVIHREEARSLPLRINTSELGPGTHSASLRISSNDPVRPEILVPVTVRITPPVAEIAPTEIRVNEAALHCTDGDTHVQFVELSPVPAGTVFRSTVGLRAEDRTGNLIFDQSAIFPGRGEGSVWPASVRWLLASPGFGPAVGITPDAILAGPLDPLGGTITLHDTATPGRILHRFSYGLGGGPEVPPPGASLHWNDGELEVDEASPENSQGVIAEFDCPCPSAAFDFEFQRTYSSEPAEARNYSPGSGRFSEAAYDMPSGSWSVYGYGTSSKLTIEESFVVDGVPAGIPVSFRVLHHVAGSAFGEENDLGIPHSGSMQAGIADDEGRSSALSLFASANSSPSSRTISRPLHLDLTRPAHQPFRLTMSGGGGGTFHARPGGAGRVNGTLEFQGLPPGARVRSCRGFEARGEILDATPPEITIVPDPSALRPPNHRLVPVSVNVTVKDDFDPEPMVRLVSIVSSQPDAGGGKGDEAGDVQEAEFGSDDRRVMLRAERSGNGEDRVYTLTYEAEDFFGNVASASADVIVAHDQSIAATASEEMLAIADHASSSIRFVFETAEPARGALLLFDAAGRRIAEIPFDAASAGTQEILWTGESERGGRAVSGLYFGRLELENQGKERSRRFKVVVLR